MYGRFYTASLNSLISTTKLELNHEFKMPSFLKSIHIFSNLKTSTPWKIMIIWLQIKLYTKSSLKNYYSLTLLYFTQNLLKKGDNFFDGFQFGHLVVSDRGTQFLHNPNDVVRVVVDVKGVVFKLLSDQVDVKHLTNLGPESHMLRQE